MGLTEGQLEVRLRRTSEPGYSNRGRRKAMLRWYNVLLDRILRGNGHYVALDYEATYHPLTWVSH
jgi:hypothetical protein